LSQEAATTHFLEQEKSWISEVTFWCKISQPLKMRRIRGKLEQKDRARREARVGGIHESCRGKDRKVRSILYIAHHKVGASYGR
jgi:hypothetical protein